MAVISIGPLSDLQILLMIVSKELAQVRQKSLRYHNKAHQGSFGGLAESLVSRSSTTVLDRL